MSPNPGLVAAGLVVGWLGMAGAAFAAPPVKKILFFSKSSLYEHSVIKDPKGPFTPKPGSEIPGLAFEVLGKLGAKHGIDFTFSKDGRIFTPENLARFDACCFYTTGDLTKTGDDGNPPMTPAGKRALLEAIANGKGFVGLHSASDTFHSPGGADIKSAARYRDDGERADDYIKMIGGEFIVHGEQQNSRLIVADPGFPGVKGMAPVTRLYEEWYSLKNFAPDLHVLLVQDTTGMHGSPYDRPNYPSTWIRRQGKGRVFYTSMGHRDDVWKNPKYQALLAAAFDWVTGRIEADTTPNLERVAPGAGTLPKP